MLFKRACYLSQTLAEDIYSVIFYERVVYVVAEELTADLLVFLFNKFSICQCHCVWNGLFVQYNKRSAIKILRRVYVFTLQY